MKSPRHRKPKWSRQNTPEALIRRKARIDARREALAASLPPAFAGPEPLSAWQTVLVLDAAGEVRHSIRLYVPTCGRCDQHAAEVDGVRVPLVTATDVGRRVAAMIRKRPSLSVIAEVRRDEWRGAL